MGDLSLNQQKCLQKINGRPILDYIVKMLLAQGINHLIFVLSHLEYQVREYILTINNYSKISYIKTEHKGTAGALSDAFSLVNSEKFLYVHGDMYFKPNLLNEMLSFWNPSKMRVLVALSNLRLASTHPYMCIDSTNKIDEIFFPGRGETVPDNALCSLECMLLTLDFANQINNILTNAMVADAINLIKSESYGYLYKDIWFHLETLENLNLKNNNSLFNIKEENQHERN